MEAIRQTEMFALVDDLEADFPEGARDPFGREVRQEHLDGAVTLGRLLVAGFCLDHEQMIRADGVFRLDSIMPAPRLEFKETH